MPPRTILGLPVPREAFVIYLVLLGLLAVNLVLAVLPIGAYRIAPIVVVALVQAFIILNFSMEVRREPKLVKMFAGLGFVFVLVMFALTLMDYLYRAVPYATITPEDAAVERVFDSSRDPPDDPRDLR